MITNDTKIATIKESKGWVTNIDESDLSEDYFSRVRGIRNATPSLIFQRDNGTKHRYAAGLYPVMNLTPTTVTLLDSTSINDPVDNVEYDLIAGLDKDNNLHVWAWDGAKFTELTRIIHAQISGAVTNAAGAIIGTKTETENSISIAGTGLPTGSFPDNMEGWTVVNFSTGFVTSGIITKSASNDAHHFVLAGINPGSGGMGWAADNNLVMYRSGGLFNATYVPGEGVTPHIRWITNDTQRKATLLYGNSNTPVTAQVPLIFMRRPRRSYFYAGATPGTPEYVLPVDNTSAWYTEQGGGLCTYEAVFGDRINVKRGTTAVDSSTAVAPDTTSFPEEAWLNIRAACTTADGGAPTATSVNTYSFVHVTIGYDNYEESDPVFKFFHAVVNSGGVQDIAFEFRINPATMPKNVTQIRIYRYEVSLLELDTPEQIHAFLSAIGDDQLFLTKTIDLQKFQNANGEIFSVTTDVTNTHGRWLYITYTNGLKTPETSDSVESNLGHAVVDNRFLLTPRYSARATKSQGAVIVVDKNDTTLEVSSYDGSGVHEDDNFPGETTDTNGATLEVFLSSFGELLGLSINNDQIVALKRNALELSDFQASQNQQVVQADVLAKRSIVQTPYGLVWAGLNAVYILPADGSEIQILNKEWKNWYDGTLLTSNVTPTAFLTLAQKQAVFSGYDPTYNAYWMAMTCQTDDGTTTEQFIARYYFEGVDNEGKQFRRWDIRQLGGFTASWLARRRDTITVGQSAGLLYYPNNVGAGNYKDNVASNDTGGTGIPTKFRLSLGSLYALSLQNVFTGLKFDVGTLGTGSFRYRIYANSRKTPLVDRGYNVGNSSHVCEFDPFGSVRNLAMEVELTTDVENISRLEFNTIEFRFLPRPSSGPGQR